MIHLFITYAHRNQHGAARRRWYAVATLERAPRIHQLRTSHLMPFATEDDAADYYNKGILPDSTPPATWCRAICEIDPSTHDSIIRSLTLPTGSMLWWRIHQNSLINHVRDNATAALAVQLAAAL